MNVIVIIQFIQNMVIVFLVVGVVKLPKKIRGCVECFNEIIELKLIVMILNYSKEYFLTTYQCPDCGAEVYDRHQKNQIELIPDEIQPVHEAKNARMKYLKKLEIYEQLEDETDEDKILQLKNNPDYDENFDPDFAVMY